MFGKTEKEKQEDNKETDVEYADYEICRKSKVGEYLQTGLEICFTLFDEIHKAAQITHCDTGCSEFLADLRHIFVYIGSSLNFLNMGSIERKNLLNSCF